jgi:hypothetical protein
VHTERLSTPDKTAKHSDLWRMGVLPVLVIGSLAGLLGVYWDIAWHIDIGRDSFFTLPHNFIYANMLVVLVMSVYGLFRDRRNTPFHLSFGAIGLHPGILMVTIGAALVLFFAPADDLWHRLYGADITLWGPMHLVGLLGFTTATLGGMMSSWLEYNLNASRRFLLTTILFAAVLLGWMMLYLAEFEYNVPAFPIFWHIVLLTALPTYIFVVMASLHPLPYSATLIALTFTLFRVVLMLWLMITESQDLAGASRPAIPFLLLSSVAADVLLQRKIPVWLSSLIIGTITFLSNVPLAWWQNFSWHTQAILIGLPLGLVLSILLGYLGKYTASALPRKS